MTNNTAEFKCQAVHFQLHTHTRYTYTHQRGQNRCPAVSSCADSGSYSLQILQCIATYFYVSVYIHAASGHILPEAEVCIWWDWSSLWLTTYGIWLGMANQYIRTMGIVTYQSNCRVIREKLTSWWIQSLLVSLQIRKICLNEFVPNVIN